MLKTLAIENFRSLRKLVIPLRELTVVTGENGTGKSSLYRALRLLSETAAGSLIGSLAKEGGLDSTLWAGPEVISSSMRHRDAPPPRSVRKGAIRLQIGFAAESFSYGIDLGLPTPSDTAFTHDPEIKLEHIWGGTVPRKASLLAERKNSIVRIRSEDGSWSTVTRSLEPFQSMLSEVSDPERAPEVLRLRDSMRSWRFYDHFRTDSDAPARRPQVATRTLALAHDGTDLAAAMRTILEMGDGSALATAIEDAFPGAHVDTTGSTAATTLIMHQQGLLRPLQSSELSDGTLRYLMWVAALLTPRPPELMVINEPETSLHVDLLPALARLISVASQRSQVWLISHSKTLVDAIAQTTECQVLALTKEYGETVVPGLGLNDVPSWNWPPR